ncbi:MAG: hypothetical protein Q9201_000471 [Fulgogasparrea decipioides]
MADLDDDVTPIPQSIHHPSSPPSSDDDEPFLDFRTLSSALPRRGLKDFESHGTQSQLSILENSRQAMHDALSVGRIHTGKGTLVGYFDMSGDGSEEVEEETAAGEEKEGALDCERRRKRGERQVVIEKPFGQHIRTTGMADREGRLWLLPEEVLYLVERGSLEVRYRTSSATSIPRNGNKGKASRDDKIEDEEGVMKEAEKVEEVGEEGWDSVSMSLQACYAWFIGRDGLSLERFTVYAGLRRSGYIVMRAPGWYTRDDDRRQQQPPAIHAQENASKEEKTFSIWQWLYKAFLERKAQEPPPLGPLVGRGLYRNYSDIYRLLQLIPHHDPTSPSPITYGPPSPPAPSSTTPPPPPQLLPHFHIYKPTPTFRKSCPGTPSFRISVLSAREASFPTLQELSGLLERTPYDPPPENEGRSYARLKHGYRNVVLAVVDQGVVSYLRVSEAGFGKEKMYERKTSSGQGKKGRGGGRGRGGGGRARGRGRGG